MMTLARLLTFGAALSLSTLSALSLDQVQPPGLTSAAIDPTLFRDGEVRRRNERFGAWSLDCDEIPRLGQRLCSLRTLATDTQGVGIARMTISTDERGRPAALFDLPLGVDLNRPIEISPTGGLVLGEPSEALVSTTRRLKERARSKGAGGQIRTDILKAKLRTDVCDAAGCHVIWALTPADIAALRAGASLQLVYAMRTRRVELSSLPLSGSDLIRKGLVDSGGLNDAIGASIR